MVAQLVEPTSGQIEILEKTQFMTMVRKGDWKLVHFVDSDEGQLFDLWVDPQEVNNRWDDPECADVKQSLLGNPQLAYSEQPDHARILALSRLAGIRSDTWCRKSSLLSALSGL